MAKARKSLSLPSSCPLFSATCSLLSSGPTSSSSATLKPFFPDFFARYIAWSAFSKSSSYVSPSIPDTARPMLVVMHLTTSSPLYSFASALHRFLAFIAAFCASTFFMNTKNSSPPTRPIISFPLNCDLMPPATSDITVSPNVCPNVSFILLKLSISITNITCVSFGYFSRVLSTSI